MRSNPNAGPMLRRALLNLRAYNSAAPIAEAVHLALRDAGWSDEVRDAHDWESGSGLMAMAEDLAAKQPAITTKEFVDAVEQRLTMLDPPRSRAVSLLTMHAAKGLEWQHVFLPEVTDALLPYPDVPEPAERNLLYVAATRASDALHISYPVRDERGRAVSASPLLPAGAATVQGRAASAPRKAPAQTRTPEPEISKVVAVCRHCGKGLPTTAEIMLQRCSTCPSTLDELALLRLRKWRQETAATTDRPEWLIASDQLLEALAELRPQTPEQLAGLAGLPPTLLSSADEVLRAIAG